MLAGILPLIYREVLETAWEHQDAGRPVYIVTAASQELAESLAGVLALDGGIGVRSEVKDGVYTGARPGRSPTARARPRRSASCAERGIDLGGVATPTPTRSRTCRCCARSAIRWS